MTLIDRDGSRQSRQNELMGDINTTLTARIAALEASQAVQDAELIRLEADKADTADALQFFSFAAYCGLRAATDTPFADLGATWQDLDFMSQETVAPRGFTVDTVLSRFAFDYEGVYSMALSGAIEHNSSNGGRKFSVRLYNHTAGEASGGGFILSTGRNAEGTAIVATIPANIEAAAVGASFGLQISSASDSYNSVNFQTMSIYVNAESEWREDFG